MKMQIAMTALCMIIALCFMCLVQATSDTTHVGARYSSRLDGQMQKVANSKSGFDSSKRLKNPMRFRYVGTDLPPVEKDLSGSAVRYCNGPPGEILVPTEFKQEFSWTAPSEMQDECDLQAIARLIRDLGRSLI